MPVPEQIKSIRGPILSPGGVNVTVSVNDLAAINVIIGKNGCGKSTLLKGIDLAASNNRTEWGKVKYITPERGGTLTYEAGIAQTLSSQPDWIVSSRRTNQLSQFRQQSMAQFQLLENLVLREMERRRDFSYSFDPIVAKINDLLDNIKIVRDSMGFKVFNKLTNNEIGPQVLSSGESELISLAIECLIFSREVDLEKGNLLLLDKPDVHLHPDLQSRLLNFIKELVAARNFTVIIATHSTAILGELSDSDNASVAFMKSGENDISFASISEGYKKILPIFGAHPLSNVFNHAPILIVEGEDDERIWQQAVRTSQRRIKLYLVPAGGVAEMNLLEEDAKQIIEAVYDRARGYSLRDRDEGPEEIVDLPPIIRMRLSCRAAENLILSDDVLKSLDLSWEDVKSKIDVWLSVSKEHQAYDMMKCFADKGYERKTFDLKELRMILLAIINSKKSWEVLVGQVLATLHRQSDFPAEPEGSMVAYLGPKVAENLLPR